MTGMKVKIHAFWTSSLHAGEWSASCSACFTPKELMLRLRMSGTILPLPTCLHGLVL